MLALHKIMNLLDRLLEHDRGVTRQLLAQCQTLSSNQWQLPFLIGHVTLLDTFDHMLRNVEVWTDLMSKQPVREAQKLSAESAETISTRWDNTYNEFAQLAREIEQSDRINELYCDTLDNPPRQKSYGGTILHVISHNTAHRAEAMHMMRRLGIDDVVEGDMLSWEMRRRQG